MTDHIVFGIVRLRYERSCKAVFPLHGSGLYRVPFLRPCVFALLYLHKVSTYSASELGTQYRPLLSVCLPPFPQGKQRKSRIQLLQLGILVLVPNIPPPSAEVHNPKRCVTYQEDHSVKTRDLP